jgi:hypothetical protein
VAALQGSFDAYDARLAQSDGLRACAARKFELPAAMACGTIRDFHLGLEGRIGATVRTHARARAHSLTHGRTRTRTDGRRAA